MLLWIVLTFIVLAFILAFIVLAAQMQLQGFSLKDMLYIRSHWMSIMAKLSHNPSRAVLDADKLLDFALKQKGVTGTLGEKLKKSRDRFSDINGVWRAHNLRNKIAHELSDIKKSEAKSALKQFKKALNDLGARL